MKTSPKLAIALFSGIFITSANAWVISDLYESQNPKSVCSLNVTNTIANPNGTFSVSQCGATLIAEDLALTAAHCLMDVTSTLLHEVRLDCASEPEPLYGVVIANPLNWSEQAAPHDIGLIRLSGRAKKTRPMEIAQDENELALALENPCYLSGFGPSKTERTAGTQNTARIHGIEMTYDIFDELVLATDDSITQIDHGDSGGALYCKNAAGSETLVGTISMTMTSKDPNDGRKPVSIFTPVTALGKMLQNSDALFSASAEQLKKDAILWLNIWQIKAQSGTVAALVDLKKESSLELSLPFSETATIHFNLHPSYLQLNTPHVSILKNLEQTSLGEIWKSAHGAYELLRLADDLDATVKEKKQAFANPSAHK